MRAAGATVYGIAKAEPVDNLAAERYRKWIDGGNAAGMDYMTRYGDVRDDPRLLLDGARSLIVAAFSYCQPRLQPADAPQFATYAYGRDYHDVLRSRLTPVTRYIESTWGGTTRICVDTAPLRERYWASRAALGFIGRNNQLIIPGRGSYFLLGTILTTVHFTPDEPCTMTCGDCRACVDACPGSAISGYGCIDARRCLSYLTIEHRGDLPAGTRLGNHIYGCDECQRACPHNRHALPGDIGELHATDEFLSLDRSAIASMDQDEFRRIFGKSAVKRTKLAGLLRNLTALD